MKYAGTAAFLCLMAVTGCTASAPKLAANDVRVTRLTLDLLEDLDAADVTTTVSPGSRRSATTVAFHGSYEQVSARLEQLGDLHTVSVGALTAAEAMAAAGSVPEARETVLKFTPDKREKNGGRTRIEVAVYESDPA